MLLSAFSSTLFFYPGHYSLSVPFFYLPSGLWPVLPGLWPLLLGLKVYAHDNNNNTCMGIYEGFFSGTSVRHFNNNKIQLCVCPYIKSMPQANPKDNVCAFLLFLDEYVRPASKK